MARHDSSGVCGTCPFSAGRARGTDLRSGSGPIAQIGGQVSAKRSNRTTRGQRQDLGSIAVYSKPLHFHKFLVWPGKTPPNRILSQNASQTDLLPYPLNAPFALHPCNVPGKRVVKTKLEANNCSGCQNAATTFRFDPCRTVASACDSAPQSVLCDSANETFLVFPSRHAHSGRPAAFVPRSQPTFFLPLRPFGRPVALIPVAAAGRLTRGPRP